jgi:hypothetical protein
MRIIVFIIIALIQLAAATVGFFMLLLGMNGFQEREATPGLIFYIVLSLASAVGLGLAGAVASKALVERKALGRFAASSLSIFGFSVAGVIVMVVGFFVALVIASVVRGMR